MQSDITKLSVDALVNTANEMLLGGGGVDGAIHRAAGPDLLKECKKIGGCPTGEARITKGYKLAAKYVIHTVGPVWRGGNRDEEKLLASCYKASLGLAHSYHITTVAFPSISTGAYGFPVEKAASIAIDMAMQVVKENESFTEIRFVLFDEFTFNCFKSALDVHSVV